MARVRASWVGPDNGNLNAHVGWLFSSDASITVSGIWWRKTALSGPPTSVIGRIWRVADQTSIADTGTVDVTGQSTGADHLLNLTASVGLSPSTSYIVSVLWSGKADFNNVGDLASPIVSADTHVTIPAKGSVFGNPGDGDIYPSHGGPSGSFDGMFEVDIEYALSGATVEGTLTGSLGTLTATIAGARHAAGTLAGPLGTVTASIAGAPHVVGTLAGHLGPLEATILTVHAVGAGARTVTQSNHGRVITSTKWGRRT